MRPCSHCKHPLERAATACTKCGRDVAPEVELQGRLVTGTLENPTWTQAFVVAAVCGIAGWYFGDLQIGVCTFLIGLLLSMLG